MAILPLTAYHAWLVSAQPGDRFAYYEGDLYHDRQFETNVLTTEARYDLCRLADEIYQSAKQDHVLLCQQRSGPRRWIYLAIRRRPPNRRPRTQPRLVFDKEVAA